jgi:tetratricopeptide (TPR) repeat protein
MRGTSYYHNNQFRPAINDFNSFLKYDSGNAEVIGSRGMAHFKAGQRLDAYVDFAASENPHAINFTDAAKLIDSMLIKSDTIQVLARLDIMTKSAPFFTEGFVRQLKINVAQKKWELVKTRVHVAVRNSRVDAPTTDHSYLLTLQAITFQQSRQHEDALSTFNSAIKFDKSNSLAFFERGKLFLEMGKRNKAEADLKTASTLGNREAKTMLASLPKD